MAKSSSAISVRGLGKKYLLGVTHADSIRELVNRTGRMLWPRQSEAVARGLRVQAREHWALRDVSFDVRPGEVLGVIGRNGAGKSTLLKILSRITLPTVGRAEIRGRVSSLLEVGTGFHPELTGRENVFLNGAILGMSRSEVRRKFDQIVAFSEVERFIDTPVKRYSSGMQVRLAFAVAAHLEPDILVVDEVLAVGDAAFQERCIGRMHEVSHSGRTVLFVSHNMAVVRSLCENGILLSEGQVLMRGSADECIDTYLASHRATVTVSSIDLPRPADAPAWMSWARLVTPGAPGVLRMGESLTLEVGFEADPPTRHPRLGLVISTADDVAVLNANNHYLPSTPFPKGRRGGVIRCSFGTVPLMAGTYKMSLWFGTQHLDTHTALDALTFEVAERDCWGLGRTPPRNSSLLWWPADFDLLSSAE
jgi:lipopolysaccharide transport system ATP-binding protein